MIIHCSDDPARALANRLVRELAAASTQTLALSGGSTPRSLFQLLTTDYAGAIDWLRVTVFQVDERAVPPDHVESNWRMIHEELPSVAQANEAIRMRGEREGAAEEYERIIREKCPAKDDGIPCLDIVVLGMGKDGHTASIFPGSPVLNESEKLVVWTKATASSANRVTMTLPLINAARHKLFLVRGAGKAVAFRMTQEGRTPASRITGAEWYIDPAVDS